MRGLEDSHDTVAFAERLQYLVGIIGLIELSDPHEFTHMWREDHRALTLRRQLNHTRAQGIRIQDDRQFHLLHNILRDHFAMTILAHARANQHGGCLIQTIKQQRHRPWIECSMLRLGPRHPHSFGHLSRKTRRDRRWRKGRH